MGNSNTKPQHPGSYVKNIIKGKKLTAVKAAEILGVSITNCLVFEDSLTGVTSAKASGAKVIAIPHLVPIQEDDQVKVIKSLAGMRVTDLFNLH